MSFFRWGPKLSVAAQRRQAEKRLAKLNKGGGGLSPVVIEGRKIATSFWGKAWCDNLESYSDYANRLPRGRSYVRHSCVVDLQIGKGEISALVSGSSLYNVRITVGALDAKAWSGICRDCSGSIDSIVELLQGRLSKSVMDRVCRPGDGLFPTPKAIKLSCSCPDGASMCKHVAATLYGVGARLDSKPELLFILRGVDQQELIARASAAPMAAAGNTAAVRGKVLGDTDLAALFSLDIDEAAPGNDAREAGAMKTAASTASDRRRRKDLIKRADDEPRPAAKPAARAAKKARSKTSSSAALPAKASKQANSKMPRTQAAAKRELRPKA